MNKLKLLIVEGNTKEENVNFGNAGCVPQSQNFKKHLQKIEPDIEIDVVEPIDDNSISKIISSLKKYDGVVLTGSTLRLNENIKEVKKHIEFARTCFQHEKKNIRCLLGFTSNCHGRWRKMQSVSQWTSYWYCSRYRIE